MSSSLCTTPRAHSWTRRSMKRSSRRRAYVRRSTLSGRNSTRADMTRDTKTKGKLLLSSISCRYFHWCYVLAASQRLSGVVRYLSVLLDATADGELELVIKYLVTQASWSPKYDIRVFSQENKLKVRHSGVQSGEQTEGTTSRSSVRRAN